MQYNNGRGFTIVELLVVIFVIGILAVITIVAYNGIQQRANVAALKIDMSGAAKTLELANTTAGTYPATLTAAALKSSPGTTYQYTYASSSNSYCLTGTNNGISYTASTASPTPSVGVCPGYNGGVVATLAGSGTGGFAEGSGSSAMFNYPFGITVDTSGTLYVADSNNNRVRKVTAAGVVSTLAGSGTYGFVEGTGASAQFRGPYGVAVDTSGTVYVADRGNHKIRKITAAGVVSTLAGSGTAGYLDGTGTAAQFNFPSGVTVDASGSVYVADSNNNRIRVITTAGVVFTLAGSGAFGFADGIGTGAQFNGPGGVAVDSSGNVYVADQTNHRIRKITTAGVVSTLAGSGTPSFADGTGTAAQFYNPFSVTVDGSGNVYVADTGNQRIRKITASGVVTTLAGTGTQGFTDGPGASAQFNNPFGVTVDSVGNIYVADRDNNLVRKIQ